MLPYMNSFTHDPEIPAGFQDADLEQASCEEQSRQAAADRRRGICHHGWMLGGGGGQSLPEIEADRRRGSFPDRPTDGRIQSSEDIPAGSVLCLDCGQVVDDPMCGRFDEWTP
jgi:hypothetical protein